MKGSRKYPSKNESPIQTFGSTIANKPIKSIESNDYKHPSIPIKITYI